jgi:hypothetical protein
MINVVMHSFFFAHISYCINYHALYTPIIPMLLIAYHSEEMKICLFSPIVGACTVWAFNSPMANYVKHLLFYVIFFRYFRKFANSVLKFLIKYQLFYYYVTAI